MNKEPEAFHDDPSFYPSRERYELIKFKQMNRINWIKKFIRSSKKFIKGKRILDVGCGSGFPASEFAKVAKYVCGIDPNKEVIDYAKKHYPNIDFYIHDARKPFTKITSKKFDVVVCTEMIEHVSESDAKKVLRNIRDILVENGLFIGSTPNNRTGIMDPYHLREYNREDLENLLKEFFSRVGIEQCDVVASTHHFKCWK